ncbi:Uncharacterised protein [Escherichia coli]|nr:Uncharacterised protein [Escherichia coli]
MAIFLMNKIALFSHRIHNLYILFINWLYIFLNKYFWGLQRPQKRVTLIWGYDIHPQIEIIQTGDNFFQFRAIANNLAFFAFTRSAILACPVSTACRSSRLM